MTAVTDLRAGINGFVPHPNDQIMHEALNTLEEQLEAVTRVAEAAKTYRDVRGDYTWVQMIQALDAWEHPNPATCHICHRPLDEPGEEYCSAAHPLPNQASEPPSDEQHTERVFRSHIGETAGARKQEREG